MKRTPTNPIIKIEVPTHVPLSQHVGQILAVGRYPNSRKVEVTYVNKSTRTLHCKILTKN